MEVKTLKTFELNADGYKVTPEFLEAIGIDLKNHPTVPQALKAKKEADIVEYQTVGLFLSNPVQWVLDILRCRHNREFELGSAFHYGYILGIRAERARRKGSVSK